VAASQPSPQPSPRSAGTPRLGASSGRATASWRWTLLLAAFALAVRLAVLVATVLLAPPGEGGLADVARLHDGREYQQVAVDMARAAGVEPPGLAAAHAAVSAPPAWAAQRLAPGYPLLILAGSWLLPIHQAALAVALLGAALAAALLHRLGLSPAAVAAFAVLTPSWVAFTSTAMSEGPFTALALAGLLAWRGGRGGNGHPAAAGLAFGAATLVRPVGAVLFAALWWLRRRRAPAADSALAAAAFAALPAAWLAASLLAGGGAPTQLATYLRKDLALPLTHLISGLSRPAEDPLKWLQVVFVLALVVTAVFLLGRRGDRGDAVPGGPITPAASDWRAWVGSQALFHLLLPSAWVFEVLPRFLVPALPGVAAALDPLLPPPGRRRRWLVGGGVALLTVASVAVSVGWALRALGAS